MQGHFSQLLLLRQIPARCQPQVHTVTHVAEHLQAHTQPPTLLLQLLLSLPHQTLAA